MVHILVHKSLMISFTSLPDNVLNRIRANIAGHLSTHLALSQSCRRFHIVYQHDDNFWQFVCFKAGFGRPRLRRKGGDSGELGEHP